MMRAVGLLIVLSMGCQQWDTAAPMPWAKEALAATAADGKLYAIAGGRFGYHGHVASVDAYDPGANQWRPVANLSNEPTVYDPSQVIYDPAGRLAPAAVTLPDQRVFVMGGAQVTLDIIAFADVQSYDVTTNTWSPRAPMPTERFALVAASVRGLIYAIGGNKSFGDIGTEPPLSVNEAYDPRSDRWTTMAPMPTARLAAAAAVVNRKIYVIGGLTSLFSSSPLGTMEVYDTATNTWATAAPMPTPRSWLAAASIGSAVFAIGGSDSNGDAVGTVEVYDTVTNRWSSAPAMPTPRGLLAAAELGGKIYAVGGGNGEGLLSTVEVLTFVK